MAAMSMHSSENTFGSMNSDMKCRLSPAFRTLGSLLRLRHLDLEKLRELARSDDFSDSESDGVDSDEEMDDEDGIVDTTFVPIPSPLTQDTIGAALRGDQLKQQKKSNDKAGCSPKSDEWELVDKSPTFKSVEEGKSDLGKESWFVE
ncbi:unnamed protein product [Peronospora belbahrii]|uniref:Uncharacterized protein n=1 Tax=Peronospora belbahrii TaxID=622444 RepID=A0AAU9KVY7_9STRA|nr:unnamed protein product [Peronospora belbahrii]CAH0519778.1 unnamed protein product [Peronospora belbahrii]